MRPPLSSYPAYFNNYIKLVPGEDVCSALNEQTSGCNQFFSRITEEQSNYRYAENKWSVKGILQHVMDTERIFCYRALSIARGETNPLPSFDENGYAAKSHADSRSWKGLVDEFGIVRTASSSLFNSFTEKDLLCSGKISDYQMTVLAIGFVISGHAAHHINIIRERYFDIP